MDIIERRKDFIKHHGFKNMSEFSDAVGDSPANIHRIITGIQKPKIEKLFYFATVLRCDIDQLLHLFYPNEMQKNVEEHKKRGV